MVFEIRPQTSEPMAEGHRAGIGFHLGIAEKFLPLQEFVQSLRSPSLWVLCPPTRWLASSYDPLQFLPFGFLALEIIVLEICGDEGNTKPRIFARVPTLLRQMPVIARRYHLVPQGSSQHLHYAVKLVCPLQKLFWTSLTQQ
jgi:hypothetical protein